MRIRPYPMKIEKIRYPGKYKDYIMWEIGIKTASNSTSWGIGDKYLVRALYKGVKLWFKINIRI